MKPKVSIIIPLYNQKKYIGEAIKSVLDQTYSNIEIIVVNDGSTDDPFPVIQKFIKRIRLINQKNYGLAEARNTGIKAAEGEYIQFLDADDLLQKNKLSRQIEFSLKQNADITYCEVDWLFDDSKMNFIDPSVPSFSSLLPKLDAIFLNGLTWNPSFIVLAKAIMKSCHWFGFSELTL